MPKPSVIVAQGGNHPELRQAASFLAEEDLLGRYVSSAGVARGSLLGRLLVHAPGSARDLALNRLLPSNIPANKVKRPSGLREAAKSTLRRLGAPTSLYQADFLSLDFDDAVARELNASFTTLLIQSNVGLGTIEKANRLGIRTILNLSSLPLRDVNSVIDTLTSKFPTKVAGLNKYRSSPDVLARFDEEIRMADSVQVLSGLAANCLQTAQVPTSKVLVNPLGVDLAQFRANANAKSNSATLRVLFVGRVDALKGVPDLLTAIRATGADWELTLIGEVERNVVESVDSDERVRVLGQLPSAQVAEAMRESDLLVLPSYLEGFPAVPLEALASGTPVAVSTAVPIADDVVEAEVGWSFEAGDVDRLSTTLEEAAERAQEIRTWGDRCVRFAQAYTWEAYWARLRPLLVSLE